ncbi:MAG: ribosomal-processing cysteine protease Prp [Pseudothermotoga sp.]
MIKATFLKTTGRYVSFTVRGHSYFDLKGRDIVCAAVSVLTQHTARVLMNHCKASVKRSSGRLEVTLKDQDALSELLIGELYESLKDLQKQYPENLSLEVKENANRYTALCS